MIVLYHSGASFRLHAETIREARSLLARHFDEEDVAAWWIVDSRMQIVERGGD